MAHRATTLCLLFSVAMAGCALDEGDPDMMGLDDELVGEDDPPDDLGETVEVATEEIAQIVHEHGRVLFLVDVEGPEKGAITMIEELQPDEQGMVTEIAGDRFPLETFVALTDIDVAVPEPLLAISTDERALQQAAMRDVTDRHEAPIYATTTSLSAQVDVQKWSTTTMCQEGQTSPMFAAEICPMTDWTYNYCHNGTWFGVTDDPGSLSPSHWTRSRTLACFWYGRVKHRYRFGGVWYTPLNRQIPSGELHVYTRTPINLLRRAINHSHDGGGFVRGASHFAEW